MNIYLQILIIGAVAIGLITAIYITGQRRMSSKPFLDMTSPARRKPLPSDFMGPTGRKRGEAAMAKVPHFYVTSKSRSQVDPKLVQKAADENRVVLYGIDSLEKLADRFEENEREIIRRHKEGKR